MYLYKFSLLVLFLFKHTMLCKHGTCSHCHLTVSLLWQSWCVLKQLNSINALFQHLEFYDATGITLNRENMTFCQMPLLNGLIVNNKWTYWQSQTGSVLRAVPSASVMVARRLFSRGGGANSGMPKSWQPFFSRHPQNTGLHCNYQCIKHSWLYNISSAQYPQNISFFRRGRLCHGTVDSPSLLIGHVSCEVHLEGQCLTKCNYVVELITTIRCSVG